MLDAMFYVNDNDNACKWRTLPSDFPPRQTVHGMFARWKRDRSGPACGPAAPGGPGRGGPVGRAAG